MLKANNLTSKMDRTFSLLTTCVLFLLIGSVTADPALYNFLLCLPNQSNSSTLISEVVVTPTNASFQTTLTSYIKNRRFLEPGISKPLAIVTATDETHAQATVICAKAHGLQIRIRSGGHDYEGLSYTSQVPFVVLDLFKFRSIDVDIASETAWVQAGAILGELYYTIANKSKFHAFPAGVCPTLGAGGHFSGGGYGNLMRKYGLSVDNIVDARIVDARGKVLNRMAMGEDLFWAIRGGGGASFGVILSWKIKLVSVPKKVTVFKVGKTFEQGVADVLYKWQQVAPILDRNLFIRAEHTIVNATRRGIKTVNVSFIGLYQGRIAQLLPLINESFPELGLQESDCSEVSWLESTLFWVGFPNGTTVDVLLNRPLMEPEVSFKTKSDYVKQVIPKKGLVLISKLMLKVGLRFMQWNPYGGVMWEIPADATPFPHRAGSLFKIQYSIAWTKDQTVDTNNQINLMRKMYDAMTPYVTKDPREAFQNYRDLDIGSNPSNVTRFKVAEVYGRKYFKDNFERLTQVKAKFDPDNFFRHEQSIPPSFY